MIFLVSCALAVANVFYDVLIKPPLAEALLWLAGIASGALFVWLVVLLFKSDAVYQQRAMTEGPRFICKYVVVLVLFPAMLFFGLYRGLPVTVHLLSATQQQVMAVTITKKPEQYGSHWCPGKVWIAEYTLPLNHHVCSLTHQDWQRITGHETLLLLGRRSSVGFSYQQYQLVQAKP